MGTYKPYTVCMPPFDPVSGGIRVMWGLYGWLLTKGQVVYANAKYDTPSIAIYPEIYHGNPAGSETVVRYILNKPGIMASGGVPGPMEFEPTDLVYVFSKIYDTFGVDNDHLMFLPILNTSLFKDQRRKRTKRCVFVGKGQDIPLKETKGLERVDRGLAMDQGRLADFLNECEVMYSFENPTAMNEIARLCGCKVVFIPEGATLKYTKKELDTLYEPTGHGIIWGLGNDAKFDSKLFRAHYMGLKDEFSLKLDVFIKETQRA